MCELIYTGIECGYVRVADGQRARVHRCAKMLTRFPLVSIHYFITCARTSMRYGFSRISNGFCSV